MRNKFTLAAAALALAASCGLASTASAHNFPNPPGCGGGSGGGTCFTSLTGKSDTAEATFTIFGFNTGVPDGNVSVTNVTPQPITLADTGSTVGPVQLFDLKADYSGSLLKLLNDDVSVSFKFYDQNNALQTFDVSGKLVYDSANKAAEVVWDQSDFTFDNLDISLSNFDLTPQTSGTGRHQTTYQTGVITADFTLNPCGSVSAAPEPAAWAMMLLGFGGLGGVMRARRRSDRALMSA